MELIGKGVCNGKSQTFEVDNVRIMNVIVPGTEDNRIKYKLLAKRTLIKCGIRPKISYYPIPPEIARKKELVPYYFLCLAKFRKERMRGGMIR